MFSRGILFPGYGSQYVGMGKDFYDKYRVVQELFEEASKVLSSLKGVVLASSRAVYGEGRYHCINCGDVFPEARKKENLSGYFQKGEGHLMGS